MSDMSQYYEIMIGDVRTFVCKRCGSIAWGLGSHDAWHEYMEGTAQNFSELLEGLNKLLVKGE